MRVILLAGMIAVVISGTAVAQDTLWTRVYGGPVNDYIQSARHTSDGGYIFCGATESYGAGDWDVYILRTDAGGDTLWTRTYGGTDHDIASSLESTAEGDFIITGETASFGAGEHDAYLLKMDPDGDTLWARTYGGSGYERGTQVVCTQDGRYAVCGRTSSFGAGDFDFYLVLVDSNGDTLGTHTYGGSGTDMGFAIDKTHDGGFILAGVTDSYGAGDFDFYLVKTDSQGSVQWQQTYGGSGMEWCHDAIQCADSGFVILGSTDTWTHGSSDFYVVRTDISGDTLWTRVYGTVYSEGGNSVRQTADGGFVMAGFSGDWEAGWGDIYVLRTDALGDTLWTHSYSRDPASNRETSGEIFIDSEGYYILTGQSETGGSGFYDGWILKIWDACQSGIPGSPEVRRGALDSVPSGRPNPFRGRTQVNFNMSGGGHVKLDVYDVTGKQVEVLLDDCMPAGSHAITWDASRLAPGMYFLKLAAGSDVSTATVILIK